MPTVSELTHLKQAGMEYAVIRVSNGTGILDTRFDPDWQGR